MVYGSLVDQVTNTHHSQGPDAPYLHASNGFFFFPSLAQILTLSSAQNRPYLLDSIFYENGNDLLNGIWMVIFMYATGINE